MSAYNNYGNFPQYSGYGYQAPYMGNYQQFQQRPTMPQPQPVVSQESTQPMSPFKNVLFLNSKEVAGRIVDPNTTELFIDRDEKIAYVKSADQMGFSSTKAYRLEELTEDEQNGLSRGNKEPNMEDYVKKESFDKFTAKLSEKLGQIESKLSAKELKGDQ